MGEDTMVMVLDMDMVLDMATVSTMARGLLMPSPRPRLLLIPTMATTAMATVWAMDMVDTMAGGPLMPSPRLLPIPTMATTAMATVWDMDMVATMAAMDMVVLDMDMAVDMAMAMAMASMDKSSLPCSTPTRKPSPIKFFQ